MLIPCKCCFSCNTDIVLQWRTTKLDRGGMSEEDLVGLLIMTLLVLRHVRNCRRYYYYYYVKDSRRSVCVSKEDSQLGTVKINGALG